MSSSHVSRRRILEGAAALGAAPLIGTLMADRPFQPQAISRAGAGAKSVLIPTHEFAGPNGAPWIEERLDFPETWDVQVMDMAGHGLPALTPRLIADQCNHAIGAKPLRELAEGRKTVAISFDDLTRTTPAYAVTPWLVSELAKAGIKEEDLLFIGSFGTHRPMTEEEVSRKLGPEIARNYAWLNHDVFDNVREVGVTTRGNRIRLNQTFLGADLKICISGIKVHQDAGYGGGAKAILPGLAALSTVEYNHTQVLTKVRTTGPVRIFKNDMRLDMIEAARMAQVDYTLQILYNERLQPTHIWGGDIVDAHHAGVRVAAKTYCTPTFKDADIVVANAYPQNAQAYHGGLWINYSRRPGGTGVLIVQHPLGIDPVHYLNNRLAGASGATQFDLTARRVNGLNRNGSPQPTVPGNMIVYSQYLTRNMKNNYRSGTFFCDKWPDVIAKLKQLHPGHPSVAVYPYAGMQHQEIELDG
ncbi:MAG TPA: lactate racemase domain-containing protein [Bryobacteraceae bacterium]|nr:lactate racemase domain-containing protein [Bryobacteraceae bacterium]